MSECASLTEALDRSTYVPCGCTRGHVQRLLTLENLILQRLMVLLHFKQKSNDLPVSRHMRCLDSTPFQGLFRNLIPHMDQLPKRTEGVLDGQQSQHPTEQL